MLTRQQLTSLHRRQQLALRAVTIADLERLWPRLAWAELDRTYPAFADSVAALVVRNRRTSAGLASAYLRALRVASGVSGDLRVVIPALAAGQLATSLEVTSKVAVKKSVAAGVLESVAMGHALSQTSGAMARLVLNGGRETIGQTLQSDPQSQGWRRVLGGKGCDFCRMLAGREYPASTVDFECHDHCGCSMEPLF